MIKFRAGKNGKLVGLGLSKINLKKLKAGQPILVDGSEIGIENDILIMYGTTENDIIRELQKNGLIDRPTEIKIVTSRNRKH